MRRRTRCSRAKDNPPRSGATQTQRCPPLRRTVHKHQATRNSPDFSSVRRPVPPGAAPPVPRPPPEPPSSCRQGTGDRERPEPPLRYLQVILQGDLLKIRDQRIDLHVPATGLGQRDAAHV